MTTIEEEQSKSIDEIYKFIEIIEGYLKDLEERVSELEKNIDIEYYK